MRRYAWRSSLLLLIDMIVWDRSEFFVLTRFSTLREVAFYSLSFNIVQQALILPRMFAQGFSANLLVERGRDPESVVRLSRDGMRYVFLIAAPLTLGLAAIDRAIMPLLYGPKYTEAIPVIAVVAGLAVLRGALVPVQDLLRMTEQQSFLIGFSMVMGIVNIALDLWLIPSGGAVGAAWANGIAQALAMAGLDRLRVATARPVGAARRHGPDPASMPADGRRRARSGRVAAPLAGGARRRAARRRHLHDRPQVPARPASGGPGTGWPASSARCPRRCAPAYQRGLRWMAGGSGR